MPSSKAVKNKLLLLLILLAVIFIGIIYNLKFPTPREIARHYEQPAPTAAPTPTPTPTPRPLTFAEMNALYGPCAYLPTIFYHHVQDEKLAAEKHQTSLTVSTEVFRSQMQYLKDKGYHVAAMAELINFFDSAAAVAKKSILITFDDAYDDFYLNALPILREFGFTATVFTPTGLVNNPGYLTWTQILDAAGSNILFANHTWSHKSMTANGEIDEKEISTADIQLTERGLNNPKIFAYPYGTVSGISEELLGKYGYKLAFTTRHGSTLCKRQRLILPRIRIGNGNLSNYGF